jgi:hypothetical protein
MFLRDKRDNSKSKDEPVSVRAVLTRRCYQLLVSGMATLEVPNGVSMHNVSGSKVLNFDCEDGHVAEELCDGLDVSGIAWDEVYG